jgi:hypothetical protein
VNTSKLVKRYTDYRQKNAQIKQRQKREREAELVPFLEDIGTEVAALRGEGMSVVAQAEAVTNKNRNFLYSALRAHELKALDVKDEPTPLVWEEPPYTIKINGNSAEVYVDDQAGRAHMYPLVLSDGVVDDYPESWVSVSDPDQKAFYKRLIAEVEAAANGA